MSVLRVRRAGDGWTVYCDRCEDGFFGAFLGPWARAKDWGTAVAVANLHVRLHRESACPTCNRGPSVERPKQLRAGLIEIGDRVFTGNQDGLVELHLSSHTSTQPPRVGLTSEEAS